ncbi:hypothetical protein [Saccharopolyspora sp. NPDC002376]
MTDTATGATTADDATIAAHLVRLAELAMRPVNEHNRGDDATIADLSVGDVAITFGHQKWRRGVVAKTTKGRVAVEFTTPGAINEAARIWEIRGPRLMADDYIEQATAPAARCLRDAQAKGDHASVEHYTQRVTEMRDIAIAERAFIDALPGHMRHLVFLHTTCTPRPRAQVHAPTEGTA